MKRPPSLAFLCAAAVGCAGPRYAGETHEVNLDDPVRYHLTYIDVGLRSDEADAVRSTYAARAKERPDDAVSQVLLGRTLADPAEALEAYRRAAELDPACYWAQLALGEGLWRAGAGDRAVAALEKALALKPRLPFAHAALGDVRLGVGDPAGARQAYARAIELDPHDLVAHRGLGELHLAAGEDARALPLLEVASRMDPEDAALHMKVARLQDAAGARAEAHAHFRAATERTPKDPQAWYGRARTARAAGMSDDAVTALEKVLELKSYHHLARRDLADLLRDRGDHARALTLYRDAVKATPGDVDAHRGRGLAAEGIGAFIEALEAYATTQSLAPDDAEAATGLARIAQTLGMPAEPVSGASPEQVADRARERVHGCWLAARVGRPELAGHIAVRAEVDMGGRATDVRVEADTVGSPKIEACAVWTLRSALYPQARPGPVAVTVELREDAGVE